MTSFKETSCRLCLKNVTDKGFQVIDGATRSILDVVLLKLVSEFRNESKEVVCNVCRANLNAALEFRSMCLNTDNSKLDLGEVYVKENVSGHLTDISDNHKVCRLCRQLIKSEIRCIGEEELEAIHKLVPEMNIKMTKDPVTCKPCFESLCTHNSFLKDCLDVDQRISDNFVGSATESETDTSPSDLLIKNEVADSEYEVNEVEMAVKPEYVEIKLEAGESSSLTLKDERLDYTSEWEPESLMSNTDHVDVQIYKCDFCEYVTKRKDHAARHLRIHKSIPEEMYTCDLCGFKTVYKDSLKDHLSRHKDIPEEQMYRCNVCEYKTGQKKYFAKHQRTHKDIPEEEMFKCDECDFKSIYKKSLTKHQLKHQYIPEEQMYKCDWCDFKTIHKCNFVRHQLRHTDVPEEQKYKCGECNFKTVYKQSFTIHQQRHNDNPKKLKHKCRRCNFRTNYKKSFARHQLKHKDMPKERSHK